MERERQANRQIYWHTYRKAERKTVHKTAIGNRQTETQPHRHAKRDK